MKQYTFKVFRPGHSVFKYKSLWACGDIEAWMNIGVWCEKNGYIDAEMA